MPNFIESSVTFLYNHLVIAIFIVIGIAFSIFYGTCAVTIFSSKEEQTNAKTQHWSWQFHQFWLNLCGSVVGWLVLGYLIFFRIGKLKAFEFGSTDLGLLVIALIGIVGFLPRTLARISNIKF